MIRDVLIRETNLTNKCFLDNCGEKNPEENSEFHG